jgi:hypothetical protein
VSGSVEVVAYHLVSRKQKEKSSERGGKELRSEDWEGKETTIKKRKRNIGRRPTVTFVAPPNNLSHGYPYL